MPATSSEQLAAAAAIDAGDAPRARPTTAIGRHGDASRQREQLAAPARRRAPAASASSSPQQAKEPRPRSPVRDEVELEPSIIDRRLPPEQLLAWVAGLDKRERQAVEERVAAVGGSADREDGFAVELSNYFGDASVRKAYEGWARSVGVKAGPGQPSLRDRFLTVARDPRHWVPRIPAPVAKVAGQLGDGASPAPAPSSHETNGPSGGAPSGGALSRGAAPAASSSSPTVAPHARASSPGVASSSPNSAHDAGQSGKQPARAGDLLEGGGLEWAGAGKAGRVFRNATADTFIDPATRETAELETSWTMAEFDQFELKTNMAMEVERKIHIQLAHGGVVIKSRARAFFNADQPPNDVHAALQAPARLVKHDGAIFVTDDKGMHLLRTLELLLPETPSVAGLLAHEPMLGFDIDPKQRIREAGQFVTVTVPTYERNMELVDGIMRDAPHAAMGLKNYIKVKLAYENPPADALAIGRHMIARIEELVQFSWTGYEGTDHSVSSYSPQKPSPNCPPLDNVLGETTSEGILRVLEIPGEMLGL
jgi:hypothetical protein